MSNQDYTEQHSIQGGMVLTCECKDGRIINRRNIQQCDTCGKPARYSPEEIEKMRKQRRIVPTCKPTDSEATAKLRARIARLEAAPCFPGSHFQGRLDGLKEALEIVEGGDKP